MTGDASFSDAIRDRVQKWLTEEGWKVEARTVAGAQWHFAAIDPGRRLLNIRQRTGKFDQVSILGGVRLSEAEQARFDALPEERQQAFVWEVRFDLLRMNLDFANIDLPLGAMRVTQDAYFDGGLSKDAFFNKLEDVRRGIVLIQFHIWRLLGMPKRPSGSDPETRPDTPI
jgi:hypothetical protein